MKDPSGFRPIYTVGEETVAMRKASLATMSKTNMNNYQSKTSSSSSVVDNLKKVGGMLVSNIMNGGLDDISSTVVARHISSGLKYVETGMLTLGTYVEKNPFGRFIKTATRKSELVALLA